MMKRYITLSLLSLSMAVSSMAQEEFTEGGFSYLPTSAKTASVTGCSLGEGDLAIIPEQVNGYTITAIAAHAFANSPVAAITMPSTVTSIGEGAFSNCGATYIKLSPNATAIGEMAFQGCQAIGHIELPNELERLENYVLRGTRIYTLGESQLPRLNYVGDYALASTQIQHVPLTDAVTYIGEGAFAGSNLQDIYIPAGITAISNFLFKDCPISEVKLPAGLNIIGRGAFVNSNLTSINLSQYQGSIGPMAFNRCNQLEQITLPANNPYCYTSEDGKALYSRETQELLSVLPSVERLTILYPATGIEKEPIADAYDIVIDPETGEERQEQAYQMTPILSGAFNNLQQLELPHSWEASLDGCEMLELKELIIRMPAERFSETYPPSLLNRSGESCNIYVFSYAIDAFLKSQWINILNAEYNPGTHQNEYTNIHAIERPTEQLYMAEVLPLYDQMHLVQDGQITLWDKDWNAAIEETYPQYFVAEGVTSGRNDYKTTFRNFLMNQYMTEDKFQAFQTPDDVVIQCLDGKLRFASGFDVNNYTNWFLHTNFYPATDCVPLSDPLSREYQGYTQNPGQRYLLTQCKLYPTDPEWGMPVSEYGVFTRRTGTPTPQFALHMVPGVAYNIYAIVPPSNPMATEESPGYNRVRATLEYVTRNVETEALRVSSQRSENIDILYESGKVDTLLLYENVQTAADSYNLLTYSSQTITTSLARQGYTTAIPLIGILCQPQTELEVYPDAVADIRNNQATIIARYNLSGHRITAPQRGINILKMSDGTTRKVMVK